MWVCECVCDCVCECVNVGLSVSLCGMCVRGGPSSSHLDRPTLGSPNPNRTVPLLHPQSPAGRTLPLTHLCGCPRGLQLGEFLLDAQCSWMQGGAALGSLDLGCLLRNPSDPLSPQHPALPSGAGLTAPRCSWLRCPGVLSQCPVACPQWTSLQIAACPPFLLPLQETRVPLRSPTAGLGLQRPELQPHWFLSKGAAPSRPLLRY